MNQRAGAAKLEVNKRRIGKTTIACNTGNIDPTSASNRVKSMLTGIRV